MSFTVDRIRSPVFKPSIHLISSLWRPHSVLRRLQSWITINRSCQTQGCCIPWCIYCSILTRTVFKYTLSKLISLSCLSFAIAIKQGSSMALSLRENAEKNVYIIRNPSRRAESQPYWEPKCGLSGLHKVDTAKAVMAGCYSTQKERDEGTGWLLFYL